MNFKNLHRCGMHEWGGCECEKYCKMTMPKDAFKLIVAGSRSFNDYGLLERKIEKILSKKIGEIEIVSGGAKGADKLGEKYARTRKLYLRVFEADWEQHGKAAGMIRNAEMAEYGDALIAFWDGKSSGTKGMIELAKKKKLPVRIFNYKTKEWIHDK